MRIISLARPLILGAVLGFTSGCGSGSSGGGGGPTAGGRFVDVAHVGSSPCAPGDFTTLGCYNEWNPPAPSIARSLVSYDPDGTDTGTIPIILGPEVRRGSRGDTQILPFLRTSNDGRIALTSQTWGFTLATAVFRPDNVGYDLQWSQDAAAPVTQQPHNAFYGFDGRIPIIAYFDPRSGHSSFDAEASGTFPCFYQSTLCEDSGASFTAGTEGTLSAGRNPYTCHLMGNLVVWGDPVDEMADCYDVSILMAANGGSENCGGFPYHFELRSTRLTVAVRRAKTGLAGGVAAFIGGSQLRDSFVAPRIDHTPGTIPDVSAGLALPDDAAPGVLAARAHQDCDSAPGTPGRPGWCRVLDDQRVLDAPRVDKDAPLLGKEGSCTGDTVVDTNLSIFEPTTTSDGRLLVINAVDTLLYSYNEIGACEADGFRIFRPVTCLPKDPAVNTRYEIASSLVDKDGTPHPFRDWQGKEIPFGQRMPGGYPWIDREGRNLFFSAALGGGVNTRDGYYARLSLDASGSRLLPDGADGDYDPLLNPDGTGAYNYSVLGAWTRGKKVLLDGTINFADFGGLDKDEHPTDYYLGLYRDAPWTKVRPVPNTMIGSFENQLNYYDALGPRLPYDVVWRMQTKNQRMSEVAFDEYVRGDAFVVAHMNAPLDELTHEPLDGFVSATPGTYCYSRTLDAPPEPYTPGRYTFQEAPLLQNAATADSRFDPDAVVGPTVLRLRGGARVEPVALGGVLGKGVYLDGDNDQIDMGYVRRPEVTAFYLGLWLDPRSNDGPRTVYWFPDQSWIALDTHALVAHDPLSPTPDQSLSLEGLVREGAFFHLGILLSTDEATDRRLVQVFVDGTPVVGKSDALSFAPLSAGKHGFQLMADTGLGEWTYFVVGDPGPKFGTGSRRPFQGWIDELRIHALRGGTEKESWLRELVCNDALGTLVDVNRRPNETPSTALDALRDRALAHGLSIGGPTTDSGPPLTGFSSGLKPGAATAVCEQLLFGSHDEPTDLPRQFPDPAAGPVPAGQHVGPLCVHRVHRNPVADPSIAGRCLKAAANGVSQLPLVPTAPRPDFSGVTFCTSCHSESERARGLGLDALESRPSLTRMADPRRQPLNVPAVVTGALPAGIVDYVTCDTGDCAAIDPQMDAAGKLIP